MMSEENKPLLIRDDREILSIEKNGDIILRGKKIGEDIRLAEFLKGYSSALKKWQESITLNPQDENK